MRLPRSVRNDEKRALLAITPFTGYLRKFKQGNEIIQVMKRNCGKIEIAEAFGYLDYLRKI
ncbi:hypothetical protein CEE34_02770 [Candidatus Aerophobetes bacterium Ae_b3a]|nr:MAG: hypothetical protein CEE34_02770 [Candidatus Aerophobetes bacterium Ae_b3a]